MLGPDGVVYGTTIGENSAGYGAGTVFSLTRPLPPGGEWNKKTLHTFSNRQGLPEYYFGPDSPPIMRNGKLYGARGCWTRKRTSPAAWSMSCRPQAHRVANGPARSSTVGTTSRCRPSALSMDPDGRTLYGGTYVRNYASEGTIYRTSW
jgi:hypothetical protein